MPHTRTPDCDMADLQVNGRVLAWARTERGLTSGTAAKRLGWSESDLLAIEKQNPVVLRQGIIRQISKVYRLPYGSLFMSDPLPPTKPPQFRTFRGKSPRLSEATLLAWADVNDSVDSFAELRAINRTLVQVHNLPPIADNDDIEAIAVVERVRLQVTLAEQRVWTEAQARNGWRTALGSLGIFVYFQHMPKADCMGFSVLDERNIPAICVNDDPELLEQQKIFTMLHEYCHLLLRKPGISDQKRGNAIERFCNHFAAAVLVPKDALRAVLPGGGPHRDWTTREIRSVANRFNVSMEVIAFRIEELKMADPGFHERKVKEWNSLKLLQKRKTKTHPNVTWPERLARKLGRKHTTTVLDALDRGALSYREARDLIGLSPKYFRDVKAAATG